MIRQNKRLLFKAHEGVVQGDIIITVHHKIRFTIFIFLGVDFYFYFNGIEVVGIFNVSFDQLHGNVRNSGSNFILLASISVDLAINSVCKLLLIWSTTSRGYIVTGTI